MAATFFRHVPLAVGLALLVSGLLPGFLVPLPIVVRVLMGLVGVPCLIVYAVIQLLAAGIPEDVELEPISKDAVGSQMLDLFNHYTDIGFRLVGPPLRVGTSPPATLVPLVDRTGEVYATIYRTGTDPPRTSCDMVTMLMEPGRTLTTGGHVEAGSLPAAPGQFLQIIPGATVPEMYEHHVKALEFLKRQGVRTLPASAEAFPTDFRNSLNRQRTWVLSRPIRHAVVVLARSIQKATPHLGTLTHQPAAQKSLRAMRGEATGSHLPKPEQTGR